jgi:hypothetical protein
LPHRVVETRSNKAKERRNKKKIDSEKWLRNHFISRIIIGLSAKVGEKSEIKSIS